MTRTLLFLLALVPTLASADVAIYATGGQSGKTWHGQAKMSALNVEVGRAISPRTDVAFVGAALNFDQPKSWFGEQFGDGNEDVRALGAALLLRRRFNVDSARVQFYGEVATGPMWGEKAIPASTSRFNFVTQFGAGIELMPRTRFPLILGYRFLHISNGGYSPRNPGLNVSGVVLGLRLR